VPNEALRNFNNHLTLTEDRHFKGYDSWYELQMDVEKLLAHLTWTYPGELRFIRSVLGYSGILLRTGLSIRVIFAIARLRFWEILRRCRLLGKSSDGQKERILKFRTRYVGLLTRPFDGQPGGSLLNTKQLSES